MRLAILVLVAAFMAACTPRDAVVYNGCSGSWIRVDDGKGRVLADRINFGQEGIVDIQGYQGSSVTLFAAGFDLFNNRPLGSAQSSVHIPRWNGSGSGPDQFRVWEVTYLYSSESNSGCRR